MRSYSRSGLLRYKIAPKCLLPGPFGHFGVGGNPGVAGTVRSYNLVFTYPCQPRERERWYAILLLAQGWTAAATAEMLERDPHTIGRWASAFGEGGPRALIFEQTGGPPRP